MWNTVVATVGRAEGAALKSNDKSWPGIYSRQQSCKLANYNFTLFSVIKTIDKTKESRSTTVDKNQIL